MLNADTKIVIKLENVNKTFHIREKRYLTVRDRVYNIFKPNPKRKIYALKNINLEIKKGEFFGIIGKNGSGKSVLIHIMTGAYPPDKKGKAEINEKFMRLSLGLGFNPEISARQNIYINASILGLPLKVIAGKFDEIIQFAELEDFVDTPIKYFSTGMKIRLSFSIAVHAEADIFLMDEFFGAVGDEKFKEKTNKVFKSTFIEGKTVVLVSHDLNTIKKYCNRVLLLHYGVPVMIDKPEPVIQKYHELLEVNT
ncbi:ABC transporter ATP-binding protein [Candidatus Desantisbacteria bacterium]|nr:ABC transporter ATP-binding protein [Candidatus Desantisbacteria bacterium]